MLNRLDCYGIGGRRQLLYCFLPKLLKTVGAVTEEPHRSIVPLMFKLYVNDIAKISSELIYAIYSDNMTLFIF